MKTFKQLTKKFDWVNQNIEINFPLEEINKNTEYRLFHFNRYISSEDAIKEMEKEGYTPATLSHLLDWQDWNENDWVIVLGSVGEIGGSRCVPFLYRSDSERDLGLFSLGGGWCAVFRFLGVRNLSLESSESLDSLTLPNFISELETLIKKYKK
jgi:hypothetical protein